MTAAAAADAAADSVPGWAATLLVDVAVIRTTVEALDRARLDQEARIRKLEGWRWLILGAATAGGAGVGQLLDLLKTT